MTSNLGCTVLMPFYNTRMFILSLPGCGGLETKNYFGNTFAEANSRICIVIAEANYENWKEPKEISCGSTFAF